MRVLAGMVLIGAVALPTGAAAEPDVAPACVGGLCEICPVLAQAAEVFGSTLFCIA